MSFSIECEDEREAEQRWADMRDAAEDAAHQARCDGCEECEEREECGWCGEVDCTDPECAELTADLEALRSARPPACGWCWRGRALGHRLAHEGEACAHPDHGRKGVMR